MEQTKNKKEKIRNLLAEFLGIEPSDIDDEDSLENDLKISPTDLSDFMKTLEEEGFDMAKMDLTEVDTFNDFIETLESNDILE